MQAYPGQTQEVFLAGHVAAFEFFGGVPHTVWYDNLSNAVRQVLPGWAREEQESFVSFRSHDLFKAEFCNVASGWEKGGVEGPGARWARLCATQLAHRCQRVCQLGSIE